MSQPKKPDLPDFDYKKQYHGHMCSIDFDASSLHDYEGLEEYSDVESYLTYYRGCGFNESKWNRPKSITTTYSVKANRSMCDNCPHAADKRPVGSPEGYSLPGKAKKYLSCPLEDRFASGTAFTLNYPLQDKRICDYCGRSTYLNCGGKSTPEFLDVRFQNRPAKLIVEREEALCPFCGHRLKAIRIPCVQVDLNYWLSERLIAAISRHCKEMGVSGLIKRKIAEGYGISRETLRKYLSKEFGKIRAAAEASHGERIREIHRRDTFRYAGAGDGTAEGSTCFQCIIECVTNHYTLGLCFTAPDQKVDNLSLSAAFDAQEIYVLDEWLDGIFWTKLPSGCSDDHLTILAHYYAPDAFPHTNETLAFYMTELTIAYGKFLQSGRGAPDDVVITDTFLACLNGLNPGRCSFLTLRRVLMRFTLGVGTGTKDEL